MARGHLSGPSEHEPQVLPHVGRLRRLECLLLRASKVSDADLAHIEGSTTLRWLQLKSTDLSMADRRTCAKSLSETGVARPQQLTKFRPPIRGFVHLREMTELEKLELSGTQISDAGLSHLRNLAKLKSLSLDQTRVAGPGLVHLEHLPNLKHLSLNRNMINAAGVEQLKKFADLEMLSITKVQVSDVAMAELRARVAEVACLTAERTSSKRPMLGWRSRASSRMATAGASTSRRQSGSVVRAAGEGLHITDCVTDSCVIWVESEDDCRALLEATWKLAFAE